MRTAVPRGDGETLMIGTDHRRPVEILVEPGTTGAKTLMMGAQTLPPGGEIPLHQHGQEEILFVYAGRARITVGGAAHDVGPETAVFVPGGTPHRIQNTGSEDLRMTFTMSPPGYEEFFRQLARAGSDHAASTRG
ncbi:MAG: cupin domain-containing protein [Candidatus Rokuibacteriota bacterium]